MPQAFQFSILLLTEDSGKQGYGTLHAFILEMLKLLDVQSQLSKDRVDFEPLQNDQARLALRANFWKSTEGRDHSKQVALVRAIATKVMEPNGFVFFHFDGDRRWKKRKESDNAAKFEKLIRTRVEQLVRMELLKRGVHGKQLEEQSAERLRRLCPITPYYSIESWLFQNTRTAKRLCHERYGGRDVDRFDEWEAARGLLDEVEKPKEEVCLKAEHNLELADDSFPAQAAAEVGKSFTASVEVLKSCPDLLAPQQNLWVAEACGSGSFPRA